MSLLGAAIGAGAQVIGGLLGRNKPADPFQTFNHTKHGVLGQASGARAAAAKYGFNPLTLLGVSAPMMAPAVDNSFMGQAIANAGLAVADGLNASAEQKAYQEKLEQQNADLRKALERNTLRPDVAGGVFRPGAGSVVLPQNSYAPNGTLSYGDVDATSIYTPYLTRSGEVLAFGEGTDLEDAGSAVILNAVGNLQKEGTIDKGYVDRFFVNAENLLTATARPVFKGAKSVALVVADAVVNGSERQRALQRELDYRFDGGAGDARY